MADESFTQSITTHVTKNGTKTVSSLFDRQTFIHAPKRLSSPFAGVGRKERAHLMPRGFIYYVLIEKERDG